MIKVLVIEDDELFLKYVQATLIKDGYIVITANDVDKGYTLALLEQPDIIISDYYLPNGTGLELFRCLRETGQLHHSRFMLMSSKPINQPTPVRERFQTGRLTHVFDKQYIIAGLRAALGC
jgi:DNA-binding response OmpR family regulator